MEKTNLSIATTSEIIFDAATNTTSGIDNNNLFFVHGSVYNKKLDKIQRYTLCGLREDDIIKIGLTVCRIDERFVKRICRNEAVKNAMESKWTIPVLDENPRIIRSILYEAVATVEIHFNLFKRSLAKPKELPLPVELQRIKF